MVRTPLLPPKLFLLRYCMLTELLFNALSQRVDISCYVVNFL